MKAAIRQATTPVNLYPADAQTQTSPTGKERAAMNAFQHGLSGHRMILQTHELEAGLTPPKPPVLS